MTNTNPPLVYFVQEEDGIYLIHKHESVGHWRFKISPEKALDLTSELARMARVELAKRK